MRRERDKYKNEFATAKRTTERNEGIIRRLQLICDELLQGVGTASGPSTEAEVGLGQTWPDLIQSSHGDGHGDGNGDGDGDGDGCGDGGEFVYTSRSEVRDGMSMHPDHDEDLVGCSDDEHNRKPKLNRTNNATSSGGTDTSTLKLQQALPARVLTALELGNTCYKRARDSDSVYSETEPVASQSKKSRFSPTIVSDLSASACFDHSATTTIPSVAPVRAVATTTNTSIAKSPFSRPATTATAPAFTKVSTYCPTSNVSALAAAASSGGHPKHSNAVASLDSNTEGVVKGIVSPVRPSSVDSKSRDYRK